MNAVITPPLAFGLSSLFVVGMLGLNLLFARMSGIQGAVDAADRWLVGTLSFLLAAATVAVQFFAMVG